MFRYLNQNSIAFTRKGTNTVRKSITATRIDHIYSSLDAMKFITSVKIDEKAAINSDHSPIVCDLTLSKNLPLLPIKKNVDLLKVKGFEEKWKEEYSENVISEIDNIHLSSTINSSDELNYTIDILDKIMWIAAVSTFGFVKKVNRKCNRFDNNEEYGKWIGLNKKILNAKYKLFRNLKDKLEFNDSHKLILNKINNSIKSNTLFNKIIPLKDEYNTLLECNEAIKKISNKVNKSIKYKRKELLKDEILENIKKLETRIKDNEDEIYKILNGNKPRTQLQHFRDTNGALQTDPQIVKDKVKSDWEKIFSKKKTNKNELLEFLKDTPKTGESFISQENITLEEVVNSIKKHKKNSSPGLNKVTYKMWKHAPSEAFVILLRVFHYVQINNILPTAWKNGKVTLIPKGSNHEDILNWRPITLLSVEYKLFTSNLNNRLRTLINKFHLIPEEQNGFREKRSTGDCINIFLRIINNAKINNSNLYVTYIDFKKAFDSVSHEALDIIIDWLQLGDIGNLLKTIVKHSSLQIDTSHGLTDVINIESGTRQGDSISPTIFIIFLAPLIWSINKNTSKIRMLPDDIRTEVNNQAYADDLVLFHSTPEQQVKAFDIVKKFCTITSFEINPVKSAQTWIGIDPSPLFVGNTKVLQLKSKESYKYLGLWLNLDLNFDKLKDERKEKYNNCIKLILSKRYIPIRLQI